MPQERAGVESWQKLMDVTTGADDDEYSVIVGDENTSEFDRATSYYGGAADDDDKMSDVIGHFDKMSILQGMDDDDIEVQTEDPVIDASRPQTKPDGRPEAMEIAGDNSEDGDDADDSSSESQGSQGTARTVREDGRRSSRNTLGSRRRSRAKEMLMKDEDRSLFDGERKRKTQDLKIGRMLSMGDDREPDLEMRVTSVTYSVDVSQGPLVHLYGHTRGYDTTSVKLDVHGFEPYFFVRKPVDWGHSEVKKFCKRLQRNVRYKLENARPYPPQNGAGGASSSSSSGTAPRFTSPPDTLHKSFSKLIVKREVVHGHDIKGYDFGEGVDMIKITTAYPALVARMRNYIENYATNRLFDDDLRSDGFDGQTYESDFPFINRFLVDKKFSGEDHIRIAMEDLEIYGYRYLPKTDHPDAPLFLDEKLQVDLYAGCHHDKISRVTDDELRVEPQRPPEVADVVHDRTPTGKIIMSYDIEVCGKRGIFPQDGTDPIIDIGITLKSQYRTQDRRYYCFVLGTCPRTLRHRGHDITIYPYDKREGADGNDGERRMMLHFVDFLNTVDPDILTGWNVDNFDMRYMLKRAAHLGIEDRFALMTRERQRKVTLRDSLVNTRAKGTVSGCEVLMEGRVQFDMLPYIRSAFPLRSYTLGNVGMVFLSIPKEEMEHDKIPDHYAKPSGRIKLSIYCTHDAFMPDAVMDDRDALVDVEEKSIINHMTLDGILMRGQTARCKANTYDMCQRQPVRFFVPTRKEAERQAQLQIKYTGAVVQDCKTGLHDDPISTLDFAGLYPSIMMEHNLCPSTRRAEEELRARGLVEGEHYAKIRTTGACFVIPKTRHGIFPQILIYLINTRKIVKGDMAIFETRVANMKKWQKQSEDGLKENGGHMTVGEAMEPYLRELAAKAENQSLSERDRTFAAAAEKRERSAFADLMKKKIGTPEWDDMMARAKRSFSVFNCKQNALKLTANSMYGALGAAISFLYDMDVAASVTGTGRDMITEVADRVIKEFNTSTRDPATGQPKYDFETELIYGDTDSVFVRQYRKDGQKIPIAKAMKDGAMMTKWCNQNIYPNAKYIELTFEKTWKVLLSITKKKYCGIMCMYDRDGGIIEKKKFSGIEISRRDNCLFVPNTMKRCLDLVFEHGRAGVEPALAHARSRIEAARTNNISWHEMILSGALKKQLKDYTTDTCFSALAKRINERAGSDVVIPGMRMNSVVIRTAGKKKTDKLEEPLYAWRKGMPLDTDYYIYKALGPAIVRIFAPILYPEKNMKDTKQKKEATVGIGRRLFTGSHMNNVASSSASTAYMTPTIRCMNTRCGVRIPNKDSFEARMSLCEACYRTDYGRILEELSSKELEVASRKIELDSKCQKCAGHEDKLYIDCTNDGCETLWIQKRVDREMEVIHNKLTGMLLLSPQGEDGGEMSSPSPPAEHPPIKTSPGIIPEVHGRCRILKAMDGVQRGDARQ